MKHIGNLIITKENKEDYSALVEVTGSVDVRQGATLTAPALVEVTGYVYVEQGATLTAPALAKTGYVDVRQGATLTAPALVEVTGYVYVEQGATLTAPALAKTGYVDYKDVLGTFKEGVYLNISEKEKEYLGMLKPLISNNRLNMGTWHQNDSWKKKDREDVIHNCNTTHCVAGWLQIFEKDKFNNMEAEEAGRKIAPGLACLFYKTEQEVENVVNTLFPDTIK